MNALYLIGGLSVASVVALWLSYRLGRIAALKDQAEASQKANKEVKDAQLQAVVDRPIAVDRLQSGTF